MEIGKHSPSLLRAHCYVFIGILLVAEEAHRFSYKVEKILQGLASHIKEFN